MTLHRDALLCECATLAHALAPQTCLAAHGCEAIHRTWPALRLLGLVGSPEADAAFLHEALQPFDHAGKRILVCGSCDYGVLEQVLAAAPAARLTLIDRCATPLRLIDQYARSTGIGVETRQCDILEYAPAERFHAVCAHSFIDELPEESRLALARRWRELLLPGGRIVTVNRIRNESEAAADRADKQAVPDFGRLLAPFAGRLPANSEAALAAFWRQRPAGNMRSEEQVLALLREAGLVIERAESGAAPRWSGLAPSRRVRVVASVAP